MNQVQNQVVVYEFLLRAVTPLSFGQEETDEWPSESETEESVLFGNAIGGALRTYLEEIGIEEKVIYRFMGGSELYSQNEEQFIDSAIYISDGEIRAHSKMIKEGTAINPQTGTAKEHHYYNFKYYPEGTEIRFQIECENWIKRSGDHIEQLYPEQLDQLIATWAKGFAEQKLLLGGKQTNGFGRVELVHLKKKAFVFKNHQSIDRFIFNFGSESFTDFNWKKIQSNGAKPSNSITFLMKGCFPYGVYQNFSIADEVKNDHEITGLQRKPFSRDGRKQYYLPSTSIRGVLRNEIGYLLNRLTNSIEAEQRTNELFGDINRRGKLTFFDIPIEGEAVAIKRFIGNKSWEYGDPVYIKIDRLTGSAYSSALKHQREIQGRADILFELTVESLSEDLAHPYLFPLIHAMLRIGRGLVPLGGRTSIGLGQFQADQLILRSRNKTVVLEVAKPLSKENLRWLEEQYHRFMEWCESGKLEAVSN